jgi:hypothetical protein
LLRATVLVETKGETARPSDAAFDQLERVEVSGLTRCHESRLLSEAAAEAAKDLGELRNRYAHARGKNPPADAREAVRLLDALVTDTVSVMKKLGLPDESPEGAPRKSHRPGGHPDPCSISLRRQRKTSRSRGTVAWRRDAQVQDVPRGFYAFPSKMDKKWTSSPLSEPAVPLTYCWSWWS